jgi:hypothetical protein
MPDWIKKGIGLVIASLGLWNGLLTSANAQAGNVVVYVAGNNPVTLNITRKVVTNPIVTLVNGKTSIVTGAFDQATADFVKLELERRGVSAQQTYISQSPNTLPAVNTPTVNLPSYLPSDSFNNNNLTQYRYITAVPISVSGLGDLAQLQRLIPKAFISKSTRGDYIYAGGYTNRDAAESLKYFLRSQGLDARVLYF